MKYWFIKSTEYSESCLVPRYLHVLLLENRVESTFVKTIEEEEFLFMGGIHILHHYVTPGSLLFPLNGFYK